MKYFALIDTNVIISALIKDPSLPATIVHLAQDGVITPVLNSKILKEYREVASRSKFPFKPETVERLIENLSENAVWIENPSPQEEDFIDLTDKIFFEVVMEKRKSEDAYLVTGNKKHFPIKPFIVTPHEMIDIVVAFSPETLTED